MSPTFDSGLVLYIMAKHEAAKNEIRSKLLRTRLSRLTQLGRSLQTQTFLGSGKTEPAVRRSSSRLIC